MGAVAQSVERLRFSINVFCVPRVRVLIATFYWYSSVRGVVYMDLNFIVNQCGDRGSSVERTSHGALHVLWSRVRILAVPLFTVRRYRCVVYVQKTVKLNCF